MKENNLDNRNTSEGFQSDLEVFGDVGPLKQYPSEIRALLKLKIPEGFELNYENANKLIQ